MLVQWFKGCCVGRSEGGSDNTSIVRSLGGDEKETQKCNFGGPGASPASIASDCL